MCSFFEHLWLNVEPVRLEVDSCARCVACACYEIISIIRIRSRMICRLDPRYVGNIPHRERCPLVKCECPLGKLLNWGLYDCCTWMDYYCPLVFGFPGDVFEQLQVSFWAILSDIPKFWYCNMIWGIKGGIESSTRARELIKTLVLIPFWLQIIIAGWVGGLEVRCLGALEVLLCVCWLLVSVGSLAPDRVVFVVRLLVGR